MISKLSLFGGRDKRAYIVALRQAKIYQPQQGAAAADRGLGLVHCGSYLNVASPQCTSRNARAAMHEMNYIPSRALRWLVYCGGAAVGLEAGQYKPFYTVPLLGEFKKLSV